MKRIILWESQHLEIDTLTGKIKDFDEEEFEEDPEEYEDDEHEYKKVPLQNVISTPFGFWKVNDVMNPYKQFKLWLGHTNFSITPPIANVLNLQIPGVEVLKILTRYRFIIGVGELFDIRDVRTAIEQALSCHKEEMYLIKDDKLKQQVYDLQKELSGHERWAIYVFPNGNIDFTTSSEKNFSKQLNTFKRAVDYSNGILIESNDE